MVELQRQDWDGREPVGLKNLGAGLSGVRAQVGRMRRAKIVTAWAPTPAQGEGYMCEGAATELGVRQLGRREQQHR